MLRNDGALMFMGPPQPNDRLFAVLTRRQRRHTLGKLIGPFEMRRLTNTLW